MSDAITVTTEIVGVDKVVSRFDGYVGNLRGVLKPAMTYLVGYLAEYCRANKLSGQVLHRRTGILSGSIQGTVDDQPTKIIGDVRSRGNGNKALKYAAYHEYGFQGQETVREHTRKTATGGVANVREFVRNVNYPPHAFMRPTRDENIGFINDTIKATLKKANA